MKKLLLFLFATTLSLTVFMQRTNAQIAVTVINPTNTTPNLAASYASLASAITALNAVTAMTGPITFELAPAGTETAPATGYLIGNATLNPLTSATNTITFVKGAGVGANPLITAFTPGTSTTTDGIWKIAGTNYVTIDGIDLKENAANTTPTLQMEWGYAIVKLSLSDGSQNIKIANCSVTLNKTNTVSVGIYAGNHIATSTTALVIASAPGTNANITINGCTVSNCYNPIYISGSTTLAWYDTGLEIGTTTANNVSNYGGLATTTYGIYVNGQNAPKIENNNVTLGTGSTGTSYGINVASACIGYLKINANTVSVSSSATTSQLTAINNLAPIVTTLDITNNIIQNCTYATATSGNFQGIFEQAATTGCTVNITGNKISGLTYSGAALAGSGTIYAIYKTGGTPTAVNVNSNEIYNNALNGTTGGTFYGVYINSGTTQTANLNKIYNNTISGPSGTAGAIYGIRTVTGTIVINGNAIHDLINYKSTGTGVIYGIYNLASPTNETYNNDTIYNLTHSGAGQVAGIYVNTNTGVRTVSGNIIHTLSNNGSNIYGAFMSSSSPNIFKNKIYDITNNGSTATSYAYGLYISGGTTVNIYNNLIGNIYAPNSQPTTTPYLAVSGLYINGGTTVNAFYNTIYLNATNAGANFSSTAVYASSTPTVSLRNNVFANLSTPNGSGFTSAYRRSSTTLTSYAANSDNNYFYAGSPDAQHLIFADGTNALQDITTYKALTALAPREANSATDATGPYFLSTTGSDATFLHIDASQQTPIESGGVTIATYDTDIDGDYRFGHISYPAQLNGGGIATDIGADEFDGAPSYTCSTPNPGQTLASINSICLGQTTHLTLENATPGTGVTYQWQSSPDNTTYSNILGATSSTYNATPSTETWYKCSVTCANGAETVVSTEVQIIFNSSITSTTPASRCGTGTVDLGATGAGTLKWYDAPIGGVAHPITGSPFTTPVIAVTDTFYVGSESSFPTDVTLGAGALTSTDYHGPFYYSYGGEKSQYLIKASELTALGLSAGNINSLALDVTSSGPTFNSFVLSMANTSVTALTSTFETGLSSVYSPVLGLTPTVGIFTITFTTPFAWDGTSNIVVQMCWSNNDAGSFGNNAHIKYDNTAFVATSYFRIDNTSASIVCGTTTATGTYSTRPKMILNGLGVCSSPRSAVIATVSAAAPLTITPSETVCNNSVVTLAVTSTLASYDTYIWSPNTHLFTDFACITPYAGENLSTVYLKTSTRGEYIISCNSSNTITGCANLTTSTVTVLPSTPLIIPNPNALCLSGSSVITTVPATGYGSATFQWQDSPDNSTFTDISGANLISYTTPTISSTMYYKLLVKLGASVCTESASDTVIVHNPQVLTTTPGTRCGTGNVSLYATSSPGTTLKWYSSPAGLVPIGTGSPFITNVSSSTDYYVSAQAIGGIGVMTVGAGALTSSGSTTPFNGSYGGIKTQFLFTAAELTAAEITPGNITSLSLAVTVLGTTYNGFYIQMGNTLLSTFAATSNIQGGLTTVYSAASVTPTVGLNTYNFNTAFNWDGTSNIIVSISWSNGNSSNSSSTVKIDNTSNYSSQSYLKDNDTPANILAFTGTPSVGSGSQSRPQIAFGANGYCKSTRSTVSAIVTAPTSITVTANPLSICNGQPSDIEASSSDLNYTYSWSPGLLSGALHTVHPITTTTYTVTATDAGTGCVTIGNVTVTVNPLPSAITITPPVANIGPGSIQHLTTTGGTIGGTGTIGTGSVSNTSSTPYKGYWGGVKTQMLFTAAELTAMGLTSSTPISAISFSITAFTSPFTFNGFTIAMKNTATTTLSTTLETGTTEVLTPSSFALTGIAPFTQSHTLTTPFTWDGTSNLLIETCFNNNNGGGVSGNSADVKSTTISGMMVYYSADNTPTLCSAPGAASTSSVRANVGFVFATPTTMEWTPHTDLYTDAIASLSYTGGNATSLYTKPASTLTYTTTSTNPLTGCSSTNSVVVNVVGHEWTGAVSTDWNNVGNWNYGGIPILTSDITIPNSAPRQPHIGDALGTTPYSAVCRNVTVANAQTITVNPKSSLTMYGNAVLDCSPSIIVKSDINGTGSLITEGNIGGTGNSYVERYISRNQWHYVSSPVSNERSSVYMGAWLKTFIESTNLWNIPNVSTVVPLVVGSGFAAWDTTTGGRVITYKGLLNTGDISPTVTKDGLGYNFVGNPYPSAIDWDHPSWIKTNVDITAYAWNGSNYVNWNGTIGALIDGFIPAGQGFFVHTNNASPVLTIPNASRLHSNNAFYKSYVDNLLTLTANGNGYTDKAFINFNQNATNNFDTNFDGYKLWGIYEAPQLYTVTNGTNYSINVLSVLVTPLTVQLNFKVGVNGVYSLSAEDIGSFAPNIDIMLEDLLTNTTTNLRQQASYSFAAVNTDIAQRFLVHFLKNTNNISDNKELDVNVFSFDKTIYINTYGKEAIVYLYNSIGQEIANEKFSNASLNKLTVNSAGYYMVKVASGNKLSTTKVFCK